MSVGGWDSRHGPRRNRGLNRQPGPAITEFRQPLEGRDERRLVIGQHRVQPRRAETIVHHDPRHPRPVERGKIERFPERQHDEPPDVARSEDRVQPRERQKFWPHPAQGEAVAELGRAALRAGHDLAVIGNQFRITGCAVIDMTKAETVSSTVLARVGLPLAAVPKDVLSLDEV